MLELLYLAAAGVGRIGIVDFDVVEHSNLQRQIIHSTSSIGLLKTDSAKQHILKINPFCRVDLIWLSKQQFICHIDSSSCLGCGMYFIIMPIKFCSVV